MTSTSTMPVIEALTLRVREVSGVAHSALRISAAPVLLTQMVSEFIARGEVPQIDYDRVRFGPHICVFVDSGLPDDTFRIVLR